MSTASTPCLPAPLPLYRPWWARLLADLRTGGWRPRRAPRAGEFDYASLAHLSEETLRDIGAPDWVHARDEGAALRMLERMRW